MPQDQIKTWIIKHFSATWFLVISTATVVLGISSWYYNIRDSQRLANIQELQSQIDGLKYQITMRDEKIQSSISSTDILNKINQMDSMMRKLNLSTNIDLIDGRILLGNGMSVPSDLTSTIIDIEQLIANKKFDVAEKKANYLDTLLPDFPGKFYQLAHIEAAKGNMDAADKYAEILISKVHEKRISDIYLLIANYKLSKSDRTTAEKVCLEYLGFNPTDKIAIKSFERAFGYTPTLEDVK